MNDIKDLKIDVHIPQTIPDLGVSFKLFDPYTIAVHGSTDGRMYGRRSNYKPGLIGLIRVHSTPGPGF